MIRTLWRLSREAVRYKNLYTAAILSTLALTAIIILDEATASVDVETEQQIQKAIAGVAGSRTIIAIAHRLSTIRSADQILVIEDGRITERGTHAQLVAMGGSYARMNRIQGDQ